MSSAERKTELGLLGDRFEAKAINLGERIDVHGLEPRLSPMLPVIVEVPRAGYAVLLRAGAVVLFGVGSDTEHEFLTAIAPRIQEPYSNPEIERLAIRIGDADRVDPDALVIAKLDAMRLQVIAEVLGKSVILARHELEVAETFNAIEPMAHQMRVAPHHLPWKQPNLVRHIGNAMLVEHALVGRTEVLEKPDLLWEQPELDRLYARLEDEYELRERYLALDTKVTVVSRSAQTMLDLSQAKRSFRVEWYIVMIFIGVDIVLTLIEMFR